MVLADASGGAGLRTIILVNFTALFWHELFMKHLLIHTKLKVVAKLPEPRSPQ